METLPKRGFSRAEIMRRVARLETLKGSDGGLPDSHMPGCERTLINVIGFQPPGGGRRGDVAGRRRCHARGGDPISEGFNLGYCETKPGHGPMMHNHDTNETFIPMTGKSRCSWENEMGKVEHFDLDPLDVISFPPGAIRRFASRRAIGIRKTS